MINMQTNELNCKPIKLWTVWFRTINGLHTTIEEAQEQANAIGMPFELIRAVPVAIDHDGHYEEKM